MWVYVNVFKGVADEPVFCIHADDVEEVRRGEYEYDLLIDLPHLVVNRWQKQDSLHIYIHDDLIE